ncbi:unnamed protein product, partial [Thlaspi arvense]
RDRSASSLPCLAFVLIFFRSDCTLSFLSGMDNNNWRPAQGGGEPTMDTGDWRTQLQPEYRRGWSTRFAVLSFWVYRSFSHP